MSGMNAKDLSVSDLVPLTSANVGGVFVGTLSPIKNSRNNTKVKYFEGKLSDGYKTVRFVSIEPKIRPQIEESLEKSSGITLRNCLVKRSRQQDLDMLATSQTVIHNSAKKFKIDEKVIKNLDATKCHEKKTLEELNDVEESISMFQSPEK